MLLGSMLKIRPPCWTLIQLNFVDYKFSVTSRGYRRVRIEKLYWFHPSKRKPNRRIASHHDFRCKNYICVLLFLFAKCRLTATEILFEVPSLRVTCMGFTYFQPKRAVGSRALLIVRCESHIYVLFVFSAKRRLTPTELLFEVPSTRITLRGTFYESLCRHVQHRRSFGG